MSGDVSNNTYRPWVNNLPKTVGRAVAAAAPLVPGAPVLSAAVSAVSGGLLLAANDPRVIAAMMAAQGNMRVMPISTTVPVDGPALGPPPASSPIAVSFRGVSAGGVQPVQLKVGDKDEVAGSIPKGVRNLDGVRNFQYDPTKMDSYTITIGTGSIAVKDLTRDKLKQEIARILGVPNDAEVAKAEATILNRCEALRKYLTGSFDNVPMP